MCETVIQQLESCAQMLLAPPECVTYEQRNRAQQVFIDFQKTKFPFDLCREILEKSCVPFVQFQCGCCLKNGVIRDWNNLTQEQRKVLLTYLNDYVNTRTQLQSFVCEELLLVCAIILKRIAIDEGNDSQTLTQILTYLFEMVSNESSPVSCRLVACTSILSLLNEYSSSTRATDFGLPWATHLRAKKKFENTHLKSIFRCIVTALVSHIKVAEDSRTQEWFSLANKLLRICDFILSWNFDVITIFSSQYAKHVDSIENPVLQPSIDWKEVILDGDVITLFFEMHLRLRLCGNETIVHYSLQCLNQLSSLNGSIIINADNRLKFVNTVINGIIELVKRIGDTITLSEVVPITSIINRICIRLQCRDQINFVETQMLKSFLEMMAKLSCNILIESTKYDTDEDFEKYKLANDNMFNSWMAIVNTIERANRRDETDANRNHELIKVESLSLWTRPIFEAFLQIHLTQPLGMSKHVSDIEDDIQEFEDSDVILFCEQLNAIGCMARIDSSHSINCLTHLLSIIVGRLETNLQREGYSEENAIEWLNLNEDIHWLILISTFVLTQSNYGERELIPSQIMSLSIDSQADLSQTVLSLQNFDFSLANIDPIVRIIIILLKLCSYEKYVCENNMTHLISPQVSLSLTMFVSRFMSTYLLPNENDYNEMSITLNSCFGRDSPYANNTLNCIIDHIIMKLLCWPSEAQVTDESSLSLVHFAKNCPERCKALNNCVNMNKLLEKHATNDISMQVMSMNTRKNIYQLFVYIVTYKQDLYNQLFKPLMDKYRQILNAIETGNTCEQLRSTTIDICECVEGIACGTTAVNVSTVWPHISPIFHDLAKMLQLFHNYNSVVLAILNLLSQMAHRILCYLSESDVITFYTSSMAILNEYAKHNCGRMTREAITEEESYNDILVILNFLNDLAAKDFIEWFHETATTEEVSTMNATQVVFIGLNIIMPLMSAQLLEFPKLCQSYYKLIVFLCEDPERLQVIPNHLMQSIMQSVQLALKSSYGNEIKTNCLTMLSVLGGHAMREPNKFQTIMQYLEPFLSIIFEFTLMECGTSSDVTMRESVANALFSLICCFPSRYQELVQQIVGQIKDDTIQNQLRATFEKLMEGLFLDGTRVHRAMFKRRFETFVIEIQGLLCIK